MADCSYFRCVQERRFVKRELQRWYKNMVYIVGLERVAEELMGRRKWKQYQESLAQSHADLLTKQSPSIEQQETSNKHQQQQNSENNKTGIKTETLDIKEENKLMTTEDVSEKLDNKTEIKAEDKENHEKEEEIESKEQNKIQIKSESLLTEVGDLKSDKVRPEPVDWKPQDKCYFCVDGKLLKVNEIGELVVETGPVQPEAELNKHIIESEDSSSSSDTNQKNNNYTSNQQSQYTSPLVQKNLEALLKTIGLNPNMTSLESVAAQLAAFQRLQTPELNHLSQLNPFYQNLFYQFPQVSPTTTPDRTSSPSVKTPTSVEIPSPSPTHQSGDVPLDLSAKPSGSSSTPTTPIDSRNIFRAKPRISTIPGRRTYTEEELNNALQDILSGKLGTRRAAQTYGIPRSTLRNKVYKLAIEQKRELLANHPPIAVLEDEDDKDSGGEDEKDSVLKLGNSNEQLQNYLKMLAKSSETIKPEQKETASNNNSMGGPSSWPIDPAAWIQGLMIANGLQGLQGLQGLAGFPGLLQQSASSASASSASPKEELPEFLRKLLTQPQDMKQDDKMDGRGGGSNGIDPLIMMNLLQQQQNKHKSRSSNTPEMDMNDGSDDSSTILKIPSIPKTIFNSGVPSSASSTQSKNGDITPSTSPQISGLSISPQLHVGGSTGQQTPTLANRLAIPSPSLMRQRSESESSQPTAKFNLHDVIRESISKNFQTNLLDDHKHSMPPLTIDTMDAYQKRPTISVIRNLGGTDISKFGTNPNITQLQQQQLSPNTGTGGKGTRPKRGKYRNYDRDSLVEAVKAVQRGEMSVHRAGSYYGVPHSTLEYKVKERHLMRPRKREPKPQPLDSSTSSSSTTSAIKRQEINAIDKSKALPNAKPPLKPPYGTNPNGMKIPPFIDHASMAAQLQLQSQLLWPHPSAFPGLSALDFARSTSQNNSSPFPQNTENFFAQQMLQKFQEEQQQQQQQQQFKSPVNGNQNSNNGNKPSVRDLESLYNPVSTNGSFLDGIIRSTLDKKPNELTHSTLFEHLLKKSSMPNSGPSDDDDSYSSKVSNNKRPGSPLNYAHHDIKRERTSPSPNDNDVDSDYAMHEHQQQTSKLHDNLTIKEELNGSINNSDDVNS